MKVKIVQKADDRRENGRMERHGLMPLSVVRDIDNRFIVAQLADVSRDGLGLITSQREKPGTRVTLQLLRLDIKFEIAWCRSEEDGTYTCGLILKTEGANLEDLFRGIVCNQVS